MSPHLEKNTPIGWGTAGAACIWPRNDKGEELMEELRLKAFEDEHIPLLEKWLCREHVARWFGDPDAWLEEAQGYLFLDSPRYDPVKRCENWILPILSYERSGGNLAWSH